MEESARLSKVTVESGKERAVNISISGPGGGYGTLTTVSLVFTPGLAEAVAHAILAMRDQTEVSVFTLRV